MLAPAAARCCYCPGHRCCCPHLPPLALKCRRYHRWSAALPRQMALRSAAGDMWGSSGFRSCPAEKPAVPCMWVEKAGTAEHGGGNCMHGARPKRQASCACPAMPSQHKGGQQADAHLSSVTMAAKSGRASGSCKACTACAACSACSAGKTCCTLLLAREKRSPACLASFI